MYVSPWWFTGTSICRGPYENITYEFILTSPLVTSMSCWSYLMVCKMGGRWLYSCCFVVCCCQDLFQTVCSIFVQFPSILFSTHFDSVKVVQLYSNTYISHSLEEILSYSILSEKSDFLMIDKLLIVVLTFLIHILTSFSVDEMLLLRYVKVVY